MNMLKLLREFADRQGLSPEPGFRAKHVRWIFDFDADGNFLNVRDLKSKETPKGREIRKCPHLQFTADREKRQFLVDSLKFIVLVDKSEKGIKDLSRDKDVRAKHLFFVRLLREAEQTIPELGMIATFLQDSGKLKLLQERLSQEEFKGQDTATFAVVGRNPTYLVDDPRCLNWWRERYRLFNPKEPKKSTSRKTLLERGLLRCFCSGELVQPVRTHPKISGLGGQQAGDALSSYNKDSFCSFFLEQSQNAAMSEEMAAVYTGALNYLVANQSQQLAGSKVVHWYDGETRVEKEEDPMGLLDDSITLSFLDEKTDDTGKERDALHKARVFLEAIESGTKPRLNELRKYRYYAMILSANSGRVVARDWIEGQFGELARSIVAWYENLEITNLSGSRSAKPPTIERVITCLLSPMKPGQKYGDWIKPVGEERSQLWRAAITKGAELPHKVLSRLIPLHQAFMVSGDFAEALDEESHNRVKNLSLLYTRMALLKAYHIRKGDTNMASPYVNEDHPNPAYHCGRLMAVLAEIQRTALPDVGAGVIQRYYAAASTTPALVLGRLVRTSHFHLDKIEFKKKRSGLIDLFTGIWSPLKDHVPRILDLEEQSLFALGFYQQLGKLATIDWPTYKNQFTTTNEEGE
jgi:CRISPR-associated protein Csd1